MLRESGAAVDGYYYCPHHPDGVVDRWKPADYPGLLSHSPQVIAATVLRDAGTRRDDAGVLVARVS